MSAIIIHPENNDQEQVIKMFLDALHAPYSSDMAEDDTAYFLSSRNMTDQLNEAKRQEENGEGIKISLDDIWK